MSRTRKGAKGAGYDYWTKRLGNTGAQGYGPDVKKRTHRLERIANKKAAQKEQKENDDG